ncbi:hypothetical protein F5Y18DRAFT_429054 [Xylariaceae sp. FL1019]|nr:hypothetical protein F5Y18DRAFT_429054 [Xylariaceae sp. FL1019]
MADHIFSRYISSFWSAVFAPFTFLYTRILHSFTPYTAKTSDPSLTSGNHQSQSSSPLPEHAPASLPEPEPAPALALASSLQASCPSRLSSVDSVPLQHQNLSHATVAGESRDNQGLATPNAQGSSSTGLADCLELPDQQHSVSSSLHIQKHIAEDMSNKRGGKKRGRQAKNAAHRPAAVTPVTPVTDVPVITDATNTTRDRPASAGHSQININGNTRSNPNHADGTKAAFTSAKRGAAQGPHRPSSSKPGQSGNRKENAVPLPNDVGAIRDANSDPAAPRTLAAVDSTSEPGKPGTRSQRMPSVESHAQHAGDSMRDGSSTGINEVGKLTAIANRLTLEDQPQSQESGRQQNLNEATTAAETSALPVPLVVAIPLSPNAPTSEPEAPPTPLLPGLIEPTTDEERAEREFHLTYMREALDMGLLALNTNETPVGCVLVYHGKTIAKGMNATNITRNGTRHAEFMALSALLSRRSPSDVKVKNGNPHFDDACWGDVDPKDGHIYPYGQKLHPAPVVDRSIISECVLYVTVEPCVMCASLLRQLGIKKVYFGAVNDKFGGTGGVFRVHMNSKPVPRPNGRPYQQGYGPHDVERIHKGRPVTEPREEDDGDGGNVERGYPVEGGYLRDDAVSLLRRFYVQENGRAPQPRKKEGRAARLYATMGSQKNENENGVDGFENTPETPVDNEPATELGEVPPTATTACA